MPDLLLINSYGFHKMKNTTQVAKLFLSYLPIPVKNAIRKVLPIKTKRKLGQIIMSEESTDTQNKTITVNDGREFKSIEDRLFFRVLFEKEYEPVLTAIATKLLKKNDNVIDVGANFGWYTTLFSNAIKPGKVYSYEPAKRSFNILTENIALNSMESDIDLRNVCVGEEAGSVVLELGSTCDSGLAHVVEEKSNTTMDVPVVRLDTDLKDLIGNVAYIKIDVEGFELAALKGAQHILDTPNQPILQVELNDEALERADTSRQEVVDFLKSHNYSFWEAVPSELATLRETNANKCSDVFCFGRGEFGQRVNSISST